MCFEHIGGFLSGLFHSAPKLNDELVHLGAGVGDGWNRKWRRNEMGN